MKLKWYDRRPRQLVRNVGLITSDGPYGPDVMSAEWTQQVSYSPCIFAVHVDLDTATYENIKKSKEFGISIAAENQKVISSIAGNYSGKNVDKIKLLKKLGFGFYKAKKIKAPMVKNAAMNVECKLIKQETVGDHVMLLGDVIEISANIKLKPLIYHNGKYWKLGKSIIGPWAKETQMDMRKIVSQFKSRKVN